MVCAQAFHWFASTEALDEIARVLKPGGKLGLIWNLRDTRVGWVPKLDAIVNAQEGDTPRYYTGAWRKVFPHPAFGPLQAEHFHHVPTGPPEGVIFNRGRSTRLLPASPFGSGGNQRPQLLIGPCTLGIRQRRDETGGPHPVENHILRRAGMTMLKMLGL